MQSHRTTRGALTGSLIESESLSTWTLVESLGTGEHRWVDTRISLPLRRRTRITWELNCSRTVASSPGSCNFHFQGALTTTLIPTGNSRSCCRIRPHWLTRLRATFRAASSYLCGDVSGRGMNSLMQYENMRSQGRNPVDECTAVL